MKRHHEGPGYDLWMTPPYIFDEIRSIIPELEFYTDASFLGLKSIAGFYDPCPVNWDGEKDGLKSKWPLNVPVFVNPPYSDISLWVEKCAQEAERGVMVMLLIPSRTDTRYFHDYIYSSVIKSECRLHFFKGRIKFIHPEDEERGRGKAAPFPSVLCVWGQDCLEIEYGVE